MAETIAYRLAEVVSLKASRAENPHASPCGRKLSKSNPRKDLLRGSGAAVLPRFASPPVLSANICRIDSTSVRMLVYGTACYRFCHGSTNTEVQDAALSHPHASASAQGTCHNDDESRHAASACSAGDRECTNGTADFQVTLPASITEDLGSDACNCQPLNDILENEKQSARASFFTEASADLALNGEDFDVPKSGVLQGHAALKNSSQRTEFDSRENSLNSSSSSFVSSISTSHMVDANIDVLSSVVPLRLSNFSSILQNLEPSSKIKEHFHWMKANYTTLDVHSLVFRELGKRKEWIMLDYMLRDEVKLSQCEAVCEVFNKLFQVCIVQNAPAWASKWFHFMIQEGIQPDLITFKLIMPLFRRYEMLEDAYFAYQHMIRIGFECSTTASAMVLLYIHAGQLEKAKQIYSKMQEANEEPLEIFFISQLHSHVRYGRVKEAEDLVKFLLQSGIRLDLSVYTLMITVNGKAGEYIRAKEWFSYIEKDGLCPNEACYKSIIGACGRAGNLYDALQFYDRMVALHFSPSVVNYNTLIHLHRKVDHEGRILDLLSNMKASGCLPNSATLNSVLKVYERYGRLEKLPEALQLLAEAGWKPDEICFGLLIRAYIRHNMVDQAMEVFSKLCAVTKLEEIMCHNLICACKSVGRYDEAIHVFQEMCHAQNVTPSLRTCCAVIDAFSSKDAINEGEALYKEMRTGQELDAAAYNVVLNMYLKAGILDKAAEVLREVLQEKELVPDLYLFLCMLKVCTKCGLQEEAVQLYWRIVKSKIIWTESLYTGVIHSCGRVLPLEEIVKVFDAMMSAQMPVNKVTCNILVDIFGKAGLLEKARYVLRLAQKQGVQDCITFSTMIDAYGKHKKFNEMESVLMAMLNEGFKECVEAYNSVLDAYGNSGQINKMEKTLERMRMAGCSHNLTTFNILIKVYGREGLIGDLQGVLKQIKRAGLELDSYSFTTLIHAYGTANMLDTALEFFYEMQTAGFEPDLVAYTCLISVLRAGGFKKEADRLSLWVKTEGLA